MSESNFNEDGFDCDNNILMTASENNSSYPLDLQSMQTAQLNDESLVNMVDSHITSNSTSSTTYTYKSVEGLELIHKNNRILVPQSKQQVVLEWYHNILIHPGEKRMIETIKLVFTWSGLNKQVRQLVKTCHECQMYKKAGKKKYSLLPPKTAESI